MRRIWWATWVLTAGLYGCSTAPQKTAPAEVVPSAESSATKVVDAPPAPVAPVPPVPCTVTVTQTGKEVASKVSGRVRTYELKSAAFRIEVSPAQCQPSVGTFANVGDFKYLADSAIVLSSPMFSMAVNETRRDVLQLRSENPRLIEGYEGLYDAYKNEYDELCRVQVTCPLKIRAYRSYGSFVADPNGSAKVFADFKRLTPVKQIRGVHGDVPVIVYTKHRDFLDAQGHVYLQVMETHPVVLRFK